MVKRITFTLMLMLGLIGLTACSLVTVNPNMETLKTKVENYSGEIPEEYWNTVPAVSIIGPDMFILLQGGSSSCPDVVDKVVLEQDKVNSIRIILVKRNPNMACTEDFQQNPQKITILEPPNSVDLLHTKFDFSLEPAVSNEPVVLPVIYDKSTYII